MRRSGVLVFVALLAAARPSAAEWHITPMVGLTIRARTNAPIADLSPSGNSTIGTHPNVGGAVALLGGGILGIEGIGVVTPAFTGTDPLHLVQSSRALALMGNVVVAAPRRWTEYSLRPFVSGGVGVLRLSVVNVQNVLPTRTTAAGFDVGGGAVGFLSKHTGVRFDVRYYRRFGGNPALFIATDNPKLSFMAASVGVVIRR